MTQVKVYFEGCVVLGTYDMAEVACIYTMTGKDMKECDGNYIIEEPMKIVNGKAYLIIATRDAKAHVYSSDALVEFR
jgi:hypothetical protein